VKNLLDPKTNMRGADIHVCALPHTGATWRHLERPSESFSRLADLQSPSAPPHFAGTTSSRSSVGGGLEVPVGTIDAFAFGPALSAVTNKVDVRS